MPSEKKITRDNALEIIKKFAKKYRREFGKAPAEIIIVGGGSIMLNYKFRETTQDFDVILKASSGIKDVITAFADEEGLPRDWMNTEFVKTTSYSDVLSEVSTHYYTLNNGTLEIRTVSGIYLVAMKLRARRDYRNDISDAIGVMIEEKESGHNITYEELADAYRKLYKEEIPMGIAEIMQPLCHIDAKELKNKFENQKRLELETENKVITYIEEGVNINTKNVNDVTARIRERMNQSLMTSEHQIKEGKVHDARESLSSIKKQNGLES